MRIAHTALSIAHVKTFAPPRVLIAKYWLSCGHYTKNGECNHRLHDVRAVLSKEQTLMTLLLVQKFVGSVIMVYTERQLPSIS